MTSLVSGSRRERFPFGGHDVEVSVARVHELGRQTPCLLAVGEDVQGSSASAEVVTRVEGRVGAEVVGPSEVKRTIIARALLHRYAK